MTTSKTIAGRSLEMLRSAVTGEIFLPGNRGYDEARQAWNLATDERPAVVVVATPSAAGWAGWPVATGWPPTASPPPRV